MDSMPGGTTWPGTMSGTATPRSWSASLTLLHVMCSQGCTVHCCARTVALSMKAALSSMK
jgi:hypothetical protein